MKKLLYNNFFKFTSIVLILGGVFFSSFFGMRLLMTEDYYIKSSFFQTYDFQRNMSRLSNNLVEKYLANPEDSRLETIDSNLNKATSLDYILVNNRTGDIISNNDDLLIETIKSRSTAIEWSGSGTDFTDESVFKDTSLDGESHYDYYTIKNVGNTVDMLKDKDYILYTAINPNVLTLNDPFFTTPYKEFRYIKYNQTAFTINIALSLCAILIGLIHLTVVTGRWRPEEKVRLLGVDRLPFEIAIGLWALAFTPTIFVLQGPLLDMTDFLIFISVALTIFAFACILLYQTFLRRVKSKSFLKTSIIGWILLKFFGLFKIVYVRKAFKPVAVLMLLAMIFVDILLAAMIVDFGLVPIFLFIGLNSAFVFYLLKHLHALYILMETTHERATGNINYPLNSDEITKHFSEFAEDLNTLQEGVQIALTDALKGEKMKTELITNVTHDLKNPLTSIINYIDLLKKEPIESEKSQEYIQILDDKSKRLKSLIDDLVDASKVTTGNVIVKKQELDLIQLIHQVTGEFEEQFEERALKLVFNHPEGLMPITSDSGLVYRIMENLMGNICKYALPTTRVYMDLYEIEGEKIIELKNVSEHPLNLTASQLTERFVRGDESRNTEGNGLGLSIASSLAELIQSELNIIIDGDLFKARLSLKDLL